MLNENKVNEYYNIPISMGIFWLWFVLMLFFTIATMGILFILLIVPLIVFFQLKKIIYKYNEKEFVISRGIVFKIRHNIAMSKIEAISMNMGILTLTVQATPIMLPDIKKPEVEMEKLIKVWNKARE